MSLNTVRILGISITSTELVEVLRELTAFMAKPRLGLVVFTPNPEFLVEASEDLRFRELLNRADINLPDGVGLIWASRILGTPIKERVSGADVVEKLLEAGNEGGRWEVGGGRLDKEVGSKRWMIGIAGARRGEQKEADELVERLQKKYPNITFVNLDDSQFQISNYFALRSKFQIVFACHGMKKQEEWIWENAYGRPSSAKATAGTVKANVFMGIGGSLDFITGFSKRAPLLMRQVGLEWLWRGLQKPEHFCRIWKAVFVFGWLVIKEKFQTLNTKF